MSDLLAFSVTVGANGKPSVILDGEDVSDQVAAVGFECRPGQVPILTLMQAPHASEITGTGIVRVATDGVDEVAVLRRFLGNLDATELERQVSKRLDTVDDGEDTYAALVLAVLKEACGAD